MASLHSSRPYNATISTFRPLILRNEKSISVRPLPIGSNMLCTPSKWLNTILPRVTMIAVFTTIFASCMTLPPSASLNPPSNRSGPIDANAWVRQVEITDPEIGDQERRKQLENTLTNNLLRFLRDGKYFRKVELFPGTLQPEDFVLQFQFDRYRQKRYAKALYSSDASDLSATLVITRSNGQIIKEAKADITEEHPVAPLSPEAALPSGMGARTQVIEELLRKALFVPTTGP
jgi:hypothetical protein